jgi:hypothetical protein
MVFRSRRISLAERSRSSFALIVLFICVQVRIFLLLSVTPTRAVNGRSRLRRAGFPTETRRCRSSEEAHSLLGRRACVYRERQTLSQKLWLSFKVPFGLSFVHPNTWHLICNNFKLNFIFGTVWLCVCLRILASSRIPRYNLGRQTPHFWGDSVTLTTSQYTGIFTKGLPTSVFTEFRSRLNILQYG